MSKTSQVRVWERAGRGLHVVAIGRSWLESPRSLRVVRISCDVPRSTLGPLFDAQQKIEHILDSASPAPLAQAADLVMAGLRRRFLGDMPARSADAALVEACNRLARHGQPYVLVFDAFDAADEVTCAYLQRIIERPGWLELPLVLSLGRVTDGSPAADLVAALRGVHGGEAVIALDDERVEAPAPDDSSGDDASDEAAAVQAERESGGSDDDIDIGDIDDDIDIGDIDIGDIDIGDIDIGDIDNDNDNDINIGELDDDLVLDLAELPSSILRVLRAGALIGSGFEAELVGDLLDCTTFEVLDHLQSASDAGIPIADRGEGRFFLPETLVEVLRDSLLPSLAASWHRRLGVLLGGLDHLAPGEYHHGPTTVRGAHDCR